MCPDFGPAYRKKFREIDAATAVVASNVVAVSSQLRTVAVSVTPIPVVYPGAPTTTPSMLGQIAIDALGDIYMSNGTATSVNWKKIS